MAPDGKLPNFQAPQHFLYFLPEPQGQGSLRPTLTTLDGEGVVPPVLEERVNADFFEAPEDMPPDGEEAAAPDAAAAIRGDDALFFSKIILSRLTAATVVDEGEIIQPGRC